MDFKVYFTTGNENIPLIDQMGEPGIDMLDDARETYPELKKLNAKDIHIYGDCPINGHEQAFSINEDIARLSGLFKGKTDVDVLVSGHAFTKYVSSNLSKDFDERVVERGKHFFGLRLSSDKTEEYLCRAYVKTTFDSAALLTDWKAAGFPKDWRFRE
jgi:hypothetical protein